MLRTYLTRLLILSLLWWLLAAGDGWSWILGGPAVAAVAAWRLGERRSAASRMRLGRLFFFVPFFVWHSLLGSCDVAWRALHRRLPIAPHMLPYKLRLPVDSSASVLFANCINLLPGTLTASWESDDLRIHVIADVRGIDERLRQLEEQVGRLFGHTCENVKKEEEAA